MKVKILHNPLTDDYDIYVFNRLPDGKIEVAKPVEFIMETREEAEIIKPTFSLNALQGSSFLKSFFDELIESGFTAPAEEQLKGELGATKYHLEDLRKLLGLDKKGGERE